LITLLLVADLEPQIVDGLIGDGGRHHRTVDVDAHMGGGGALLDVDDFAGKGVAGGNPHLVCPCSP